jgi:hypothetical protein
MSRIPKLVDCTNKFFSGNAQTIEYEGTEDEKRKLEEIANEVPIYCVTQGKRNSSENLKRGIKLRFGGFGSPAVSGIERGILVSPLNDQLEYYMVGCFEFYKTKTKRINNPSIRFIEYHPYSHIKLVWEKNQSEKYEFTFSGC